MSHCEHLFHLQDEDLWFPHQTLTLVSSEQSRHFLDFDHTIVGVNMSVFTVAQKHADEAVSICVISFCSWGAKVFVSVKEKHFWEKILNLCAYLQ